jgi:hypothetical protein
MSKWTSLSTFDDWKEKLREILDEGRKASEENDNEDRLAICQQLLTFIDKSPASLDGTDGLDDVAIEAQAHQKLSEEVVDDALAQIHARTAEIVVLTKSIDRVASKAESAAADLRLELAHSAIDALTGAVRAAESLIKEVRKNGADADFAKSLSDLIKALEQGQALIKKKK